jgi:phenylacetate-coenzyme A ligase PaaK-like adenylate-forming protein
MSIRKSITLSLNSPPVTHLFQFGKDFENSPAYQSRHKTRSEDTKLREKSLSHLTAAPFSRKDPIEEDVCHKLKKISAEMFCLQKVFAHLRWNLSRV